MSNQIQSFFSELEIFGIKLGLEQTRKLFSRIGDPQKKLKFIHLAGTNGKGSVGAMLSGALTKVGYKIGFYSSPHLLNIRERFRINGRAISEKRLLQIINNIKPEICELRKNDISPTYFEVTTSIAALYFAEEKCDYVIWETGMGGRFDATNIVNPEISIITGIAIEHSEYLGKTLKEIAYEKAGIIKYRVPVFCGDLDPEAEQVIQKKAAEENSECHFFSEYKVSQVKGLHLLGEFQKKNAKLAISVIEYLSKKIGFSINKALEGLKKTRWPGRLQIIDDKIIIDGAHNPQSAKSLASSICKLFPGQKYYIIFASISDKDTINVMSQLATIAEEFIFPRIDCIRKMVQPDKLIEIAESQTMKPGKKTDSLQEALDILSGKNILITGSLYLAGEALEKLVDHNKVFDIN